MEIFGILNFFPMLIIILVISSIIRSAGKGSGKYQKPNDRLNRNIESLKSQVMYEINSAKGEKPVSKGKSSGKYKDQNMNYAASARKSPQNTYRKSPVTVSAQKSANYMKADRLIHEELSDANRIWAIEQAKMNDLNAQFNMEIERQHAENARLISQAMRTDR